MRALLTKLRSTWPLLVAATLSSVLVGAILAQSDLGPQAAPPNGPLPVPDRTGIDSEEKDSTIRQMEERLAIKRNEDRQRQIVKETDKLLDLASELKSEVAKSNSNKDARLLEASKKVEQIEKLAKSVGDKMKAQ
jgi:hypothetical protein